MFLLAWILAILAAPAQHGDFGHYTFALTWQPGICSTEEGCRADQPHAPLIGLHGLWASTPTSLAATGVVDPQWWSRGCDYYRHSDEPPSLDPSLLAQLDAVMPHFAHSLLTHEYDKHVQCFGFDPQTFFQTELDMRSEVADSAFGRYLTVTARGHDVRRAAVLRAFTRDFGTDQSSALQLRCGRNRQRRVVLTQLWITLYRDALSRFPRDDSFMNAPIPQHNCPARFNVPDWGQ
jgi:ribonuclease I (enterobacter ribonuclease)